MLDFYDDPCVRPQNVRLHSGNGVALCPAQVDAGADIVGIGDAAASLIGPKFYDEFVWPYEKKLVDGIQAMGAAVRLHICGNTTSIVDGMGRLGCEIVDLDYFTPVDAARKAMGPDQILLGNIDPVRRYATPTPSRSLRRLPNVIGRPATATSSAQVVKCRATRRWRMWWALTEYANSRRLNRGELAIRNDGG